MEDFIVHTADELSLGRMSVLLWSSDRASNASIPDLLIGPDVEKGLQRFMVRVQEANGGDEHA